MNRRLELLIGNLMLGFFLVFMVVSLFNLSYDPDKLIGTLSEAIEEMDLDYLSKHIEVEGIDDPLTMDQISKIATILREQYIGVDELKAFHEPVIEDDELYELGETFTDNIYVEKRGKERLIYDKYVIVLKPYNLHIETNLPGSIVFVDDVEVGTVDEDSMTLVLPDIIPGQYHIKVLYQGEYCQIESFESINCFSAYDNNIYSYIPLETDYIYISSDIDGASLYINGEKTGIELSIYDYYELGPISMDSAIEIQAKIEIDGKTHESERITIDEFTNDYHLPINYIEEEVEDDYGFELDDAFSELNDEEWVKTSIEDMISHYEVNLILGINENSIWYLDGQVEVDSPLMEAQIKLIERLNKKGVKEELLDHQVLDIIPVTKEIFEVEVFERHKLIYQDGEEEIVEHRWIYTVVFKENYAPYLRDIRQAE